MPTRKNGGRIASLLAGLGTLATLLCFAPARADEAWTPDDKTIAALEAQIKTPAGAPRPIHPVADYARFYKGVTVDGHRMVRGELVAVSRECSVPQHNEGLYCQYHAGVYVGKPFPIILDGGCEIVNLMYDPSSGQIVWSRCNGVA